MKKISNKLISILVAVLIGVVLIVVIISKNEDDSIAVDDSESSNMSSYTPHYDSDTCITKDDYYDSSYEFSCDSQEENSDSCQSNLSFGDYSDTTTEESSEESYLTSPDDNVLGTFLIKYDKIINDGIYTLMIQRQARVGGLSVPVVTTTVHGNGFINISVYEAHNIYTEILINEDGAYYINDTEKACHLYPTDNENVHSISFDDIRYVSDGICTIGGVLYNYEKYSAQDGTTVDFVFDDDKLCKLKIYTENGYEFIGFEISDSVEGARKSIPYDYEVIDHR